MTKDNWIKAFDEKFWGISGCMDLKESVAMSADISSDIKDFISQVEKDAIEKTNKRWRERILNTYTPIRIKNEGEWIEITGYVRKSDLLEDKK